MVDHFLLKSGGDCTLIQQYIECQCEYTAFFPKSSKAILINNLINEHQSRTQLLLFYSGTWTLRGSQTATNVIFSFATNLKSLLAIVGNICLCPYAIYLIFCKVVFVNYIYDSWTPNKKMRCEQMTLVKWFFFIK